MSFYYRDFFASVQVNVGETQTILSKRWIGRKGHIFKLGLGVVVTGTVDTTLWGSCSWSLFINGMPVDDYNNIQDEIGDPKFMTEVMIPVPADALIEFKATNNHATRDGLFVGRLMVQSK